MVLSLFGSFHFAPPRSLAWTYRPSNPKPKRPNGWAGWRSRPRAGELETHTSNIAIRQQAARRARRVNGLTADGLTPCPSIPEKILGGSWECLWIGRRGVLGAPNGHGAYTKIVLHYTITFVGSKTQTCSGPAIRRTGRPAGRRVGRRASSSGLGGGRAGAVGKPAVGQTRKTSLRSFSRIPD